MKQRLLLSNWSQYSNKIQKNKQEFFYSTAAHILYMLQSVIQTKIFSSLFSTSVYGKWALIVSVYTLISMIPFTALNQGIYRVAFKYRKAGQERQLYSSIIISFIGFFLIYILIFIILHRIQGHSYFADGYSFFFCTYAFSEVLKNTFIAIDNAYRNRKHIFHLRILDIISRCLFFGFLFLIGSFTIKYVLMILSVTNIIIFIYQRNYFKEITFHLDKDVCVGIAKAIISFSSPLLLWAVFSWMQNMINRWYLNAFLDLDAVAFYAIVTSLSYFVPNLIYTIVNSYVMPIIYAKDKAFTRSSLIKYLSVILLFFILYYIFIVFFGKYVILIFSHAKYLPAVKYLPVTTLSAIIYIIAMLSTTEIYRQGRTKILIPSSIMPGIIMSTVGFFAIKHFQFEGAIATYILGQLTYAFMTFLVVFNKKNIRTGRDEK